MPKEFYTEKDIEDMFRRGVMSLQVSDNTVLTELAYEKANRLGMKLLHSSPDNPPSAPVRPYISQNGYNGTSAPRAPAGPVSVPAASFSAPERKPADSSDLHQRIRSAVIARLGTQVDSTLLDTIIQRVLNSTGVK
jgi:hypothetical protein